MRRGSLTLSVMTRLLLLTTLLLVACDEDCPLPQWSALSVRVTDSLGNVLKVDDLYVRQDGVRHDCAQGRDPQRCQFLTLVGPVTLVVATEGHEVERPLELTPESTGDVVDECRINGAGHYDLVYDGPSCDPSKLEAVRGDLIDLDGLPASLAEVSIQTTVNELPRAAPCSVLNGQFRCPALVGIAASYTVEAKLGTSILTQTAWVQAADCQISIASELDFDRRSVACISEVAPAVRVYAQDGGKNVLPDSVRSVRANGEASDCVLEPPGAQPGPRAALCPATSQTGGGSYAVAVTYAGQTKGSSVTVYDDGCHALSEHLTISF